MLGEGARQGNPVSSQRVARLSSFTGTTCTDTPSRAAKSRASSPTVIPWSRGSRSVPTKDWNSGSSIGPSTRSPPFGLGRSSTQNSRPAREAATSEFRRVENVGVEANPDVLDVENERIQSGQRRFAGDPLLTVEAHHRKTGLRIAARCDPLAGGGRSRDAVLRTEEHLDPNARLHERRGRRPSIDGAAGVVGDQADPFAEQVPGSLGNEPVETR